MDTIKLSRLKRAPWVFDPMGQTTYYWSSVVVGAFLYNLWVIPYRYAFDEIQHSNKLKWLTLDYTADLIYVLDIIFGFRIGFLKDGVLQHSLTRIKQRHLNETSFYLDCLAVLPLDFLYLSIGFNSFLRIFRLVKILKFWRFLDRTEINTNYPHVFRTLVLLHNLLVVFHWNSCLVYCVSYALNFNIPIHKNNNTIATAFLEPHYRSHNSLATTNNRISIFDDLVYYNRAAPMENSPTKNNTTTLEDSATVNNLHYHPRPYIYYDTDRTVFLYKPNFTSPSYYSEPASPYLKSFYWSTLALTTIGGMPKPQSNGEYILSITQIILGLILFAYMLGQVSTLITTVRTQDREYQIQMGVIKTYMRKQNVPKKFRNKVCKWLNYSKMTKISVQETAILDTLPNKLKAEMAIYVHVDTLKRVEIFQNTEAGFLRQLVLKLKSVLFSPGDYVCLKGEVGKEMYIVNTGILEIIGGEDNHTVLLILRAGSYFGEISVLNMGPYGNRRTASVRSVGYSELFSLSKDDLWEVLKEFPNARARLEDIATRRLVMAKTSNGHIQNPKNNKLKSAVDSDAVVNLTGSVNSCKNCCDNNSEKFVPPIKRKFDNFKTYSPAPTRSLRDYENEITHQQQYHGSSQEGFDEERAQLINSPPKINGAVKMDHLKAPPVNYYYCYPTKKSLGPTLNNDIGEDNKYSNRTNNHNHIPVISISNESDSEERYFYSEEGGFQPNSEFTLPSKGSSFLSKSPSTMNGIFNLEETKSVKSDLSASPKSVKKKKLLLWDHDLTIHLGKKQQGMPHKQRLTKSLSYPYYGGILQYTATVPRHSSTTSSNKVIPPTTKQFITNNSHPFINTKTSSKSRKTGAKICDLPFTQFQI